MVLKQHQELRLSWSEFLDEKLGLGSDLKEAGDYCKDPSGSPLLFQSHSVLSGKPFSAKAPDEYHIQERESSLSELRVRPLKIVKKQSRSTSKACDHPCLEHQNLAVPKRRTDESKPEQQQEISSLGRLTTKAVDTDPPNHCINSPNGSLANSDSYSFSERLSSLTISSAPSIPSLASSFKLCDPYSVKSLDIIRRKHNCIRELYNTEWQFAQDMAVVVRVYMSESAMLGLTLRQIDVLFSNVSQVMDLSLSLVAMLEERIPRRILNGNGSVGLLDVVADQDLLVGEAMCLSFTGQMYNIYENYIHRNEAQMKLLSDHTKNFKTRSRQIRPLTPEKDNQQRQASSQPSQSITETKLADWLRRCRQKVSKYTTAWSLECLLIKPVQRLGKYPLLLGIILECTCTTHNDYDNLQRAFKRSKQYLDYVNTRFGPRQGPEKSCR